MRFVYSVQQKIRIATLLFAVMACTILIRILEDKSVANMNASFVSMYNDRLIPATDLFDISSHVQEKRFAIEETLYAGSGLSSGLLLQAEVRKHSASIDSLILKYEKTLLVRLEKEQLAELKTQLSLAAGLELGVVGLLLGRKEKEAKIMYENSGRAASKQAISQLSGLMRTQKAVGEELLKDSAFMVSGSKLYSALQVTLAIVIGILIVGIVFASNLVKISNEKFNLN